MGPGLHPPFERCRVRIGWERHVWHFSHYPAMQSQIRTKNRFCLKSKWPFVTARFRKNLHRSWPTSRKYCVWCLIQAAPLRGEIRKETVSASRVKCPLFLPDFHQTCTGCGKRGWSFPCKVWVTPLQCGSKQGRETVSVLRVSALRNCPISTKHAMVVGHGEGVPSLKTQSPRFNARGDGEGKLFRPQEWCALHYWPISTKFAQVVALGQGVSDVVFHSSLCNVRRDEENVSRRQD
jgi:hypothetical protein